jgi:transposase
VVPRTRHSLYYLSLKEKFIDSQNLPLFEYLGISKTPQNQGKQTAHEKQTIPAHERSKPNRNGQDKLTLPKNLPVEQQVIELSDEEKVCQETGTPLVKIGEEITRKLAYIPGSYYIKEIIRPKYAFPKNSEEGIKTASLPESLLTCCQELFSRHFG